MSCEKCNGEKYVLNDRGNYEKCSCYMRTLAISVPLKEEYRSVVLSTLLHIIEDAQKKKSVEEYYKSLKNFGGITLIKTQTFEADLFVVCFAKELAAMSRSYASVDIDELTDLFFDDSEAYRKFLSYYGCIILIETAIHRGNMLALSKALKNRERSKGPTLLVVREEDFYRTTDASKEQAKDMYDKAVIQNTSIKRICL